MNRKEAQVFAPSGRGVLAGGRAHELLPVAWKDVPAFSLALQPLLGVDMGHADEPRDVEAMLKRIDWQKQLQENHAAITDAIVIGAKVNAEELGGYQWTDVVILASEIVRVNADFFIRRALPSILETMGALNRSLGDGSTQPKS